MNMGGFDLVNKRFNFVGGYLYDGDEPVGHIDDIRFREDFLDLLNNLDSENQTLKSDRARYEEECRLDIFKELSEENEQLKKQIQTEHQMLDNAILLERTRMGQNSLKQYKEAIQ